MKTLSLAFIVAILLVGCASNPLLTGEPADWVRKPAAELRNSLGEPTRTVVHQDGSQTWEYVTEGEYVREHRSPGHFVNVTRYLVKDGKVRKWFTERIEDGVVVRSDH
jgi:hypothetical protein